MAQGPLAALVPHDMVARKPKHGDACNHCGLCCHASLCQVGRAIFGNKTQAPCPALRWRGDTSCCDVIEHPELYTDAEPDKARAAAALLLYAGKGCTMRINGELNHAFNDKLCSFDAANRDELDAAAELWGIPPAD